ncbi:SLAM family member 5-like [Sceloporus undulatus]|uniref:SLAM family member 5-like n=1 Tax=Sceloporus undulatus TaxID=8520 RepID=UPI001C4C5619|nr:SLAM family member 5-like [Sceloporus undulatus]
MAGVLGAMTGKGGGTAQRRFVPRCLWGFGTAWGSGRRVADVSRHPETACLTLIGAQTSSPAKSRAPPRQVNGVLGGLAVLSVNLAPQAKVKEIEWSYRAGAGPALLVAVFRDGKFERPDPGDRFKQRVDIFNETLRIKALELNDSGIFGARVKLLPAIVEDQIFQLAVYEPVLMPRIQSQLVSSTPKWCNITLQCLSPGKGPVNVTWRKGSPIRELGASDRYQVSPDGRTLRLSLLPAALNTTYSCVASNPIEHKIVSFDLQRICQSGAEGSFSKSGYVVLTFILLVLSLGAAFWCWRINNEKSAESVTIPTVQVEESPTDPQYAEILRRSPPEGNNKSLGLQESNVERSPQKERLVTTIYDQIRKTPDTPTKDIT